MAPGKRRLDDELVERGLIETRARAKAMILAGDVLVDGLVARSAGTHVRSEQDISLRLKARYVSRGGEKLHHALEQFEISTDDLVCADFGASTGGFTDCLLQAGAKRVYAIDVGYGQIHQRMRDDDRVVIMERCNVRTLESLPELVDLVVIDVSFISLNLVLPAAARVLTDQGRCVPLIKPQFEAGKGQVGKGGVVRDPAVHRSVLVGACDSAVASGFDVLGLVQSPLKGPAGNIEFLAHLQRSEHPAADIGALLAMIGNLDETV